jgi:signal peptidase I
MNILKVITAVLLASFVGYLFAWYFGLVEGNFALVLFISTVLTGIYWIAEKIYFLPQRRLAANTLFVADNERRLSMQAQGLRVDESDINDRVASRHFGGFFTSFICI